MRLTFFVFGLTLFATTSALAQTPDKPVRLVLQITVDQLRGDLIDRYSAGFGTNGFRRLFDKGAFFINAHHRHANTETVVGHATPSAGTDPAVQGVVANVWLNRASDELNYSKVAIAANLVTPDSQDCRCS